MTFAEHRRPPGDEEEAGAFTALGHAITTLREERGMDRDELASKCEMTPGELEQIELGRIDEWWGGLRRLADALDIPFPVLMNKAPGLAFDLCREEAPPLPGRSESNRGGPARNKPAKRGQQA
jgi:transcriptional regulator with XRE-family HTH domain